MKIYVKQLVALATSKAPPDRAGWLLKRGEVNKSFQKRWFVLRGNLLFYFERPDREPVGLIVLEGCSIELAECSETERYAFLIIFHGQGARTYTLAAESQEDMEAWMKALSCANYDFLRNTVAELQRQIDEIRSSANTAGVGSDSPLGPDAIRGNAPPPGHPPNAPPRKKNNNNNTGSKPNSQAVLDGLNSLNLMKTAMTFDDLHAKYGAKIQEVFNARVIDFL